MTSPYGPGDEFAFPAIDVTSSEPLPGRVRFGASAEGLHWTGDDPSTLPIAIAWKDVHSTCTQPVHAPR